MTLRLRSARPYAWFALCVFLCGWVVPFFEAHPLGYDDDAACFAFAPSGASEQQLAAVDNTDRGPQHCVLCHLMRALNGSIASEVARLSAPASNSLDLPDLADPVLSLESSATSSRGPPAVL